MTCLRVILVLAIAAATASADSWRIRSDSEVRTKAGSVLALPPVRCYDEPAWAVIDAEVRRLQEAETRLKAERDAYAAAPKSPSALVVGALVVGALLGAGGYWYVRER